MRHTCALLVVLTASGLACESPTSIADAISFDLPAGYIGKGSSVGVALVNDSERDAQTGSLPCVVRLEQLVGGKWEQASPNGPCPAIVTPIPAGDAAAFNYAMPDEIGTFRLVADLLYGGAGTVTIRSRKFQTVGIAVD